MGNDYFDRNKSNRGGKNDFFGNSYGKTNHVSVSGRTPVRENTRRDSSQRRDGGSGNRRGGGSRRRRMPVAVTIAIDILAAGLIFLVFYLLYFSDMNDDNSEPIISSSVVSIEPVSPEDTPLISPFVTDTTESSSALVSASPTAADSNSWRARFADRFSSDGKVHQQITDDKWTYQSTNISVDVSKKTENGVVYFVTDIYVADIKYFKTWYSDTREFVYNALQKVKGIVGVNGDFYPNNNGLTIRNGQFVRYAYTSSDELVMYNDGTMQVFTAANFNYKDIKSKAPGEVYQVWSFGPGLLNSNGEPKTKFNSTVTGANNSRTAIGYYEPGHYCFVTVDGRQQGYSYPGYSLSQLADLMHTLECKVAFNLDGGGSSQLAFQGKEINKPCPDTYRKDYDIIYITDEG